jgi:hypothetical protein
MRRESEIRQKLKQACFRHVKRDLRDRFPPGADWPREQVDSVKSEFRRFIATAPIHEIARRYPDVAALMWVLEERSGQSLRLDGTLVGKMGGVPLWADTEEEAETARSMIDKIVDAATREPESMTLQTENGRTLVESGTLVVPVVVDETALEPVKKSWWQRLFG